MSNPKVSVVIPNYNYAQYLPQALDSVLSQTYKNLEIIVVDDGSSDKSASVVRSYGPRVRLIEQKNAGVSAARNHGVRESTGELIAFLDADDSWLPNKLELQVQRIVGDPTIGLVHCGLAEVDASGNVVGQLLEGMEGYVSKEILLMNRPVILGAGSTMLISREAFDVAGAFDTRLSTSADWEFCYRVALKRPVAFVPEVLTRYRGHGANMHSNIKLMEHDVMIGYAKAFTTDDAELLALRRECYSNIHMVLAGSYFRSGQPFEFARHGVKSLWLMPANLKRLLDFPRRRLRNRAAQVQ